MDEFAELDVEVQLQLLTATVKLFLKKPATTQGVVKEVLQLATTKSSNPDLRDRGYIYWRLLSSDPEKARVVVLAEPVTVEYDSHRLDTTLLQSLLRQVSSLASVYHKPPQSFLLDSARQAVTVAAPRAANKGSQDDETGAQAATAGGAPVATASQGLDVLDLIGGGDAGTGAAGAAQKPAVVDDLLDLLGDIGGGSGGGGAVAAPTGAGGAPGGILDLMGGMSLAGGGGGTPGAEGAGAGGQALTALLTADKGGGMAVHGAVSRRGGKVFYDLQFRNSGSAPLSGIAIQFNKNLMGLTNAAPLQVGSIAPGAAATAALAMVYSADKVAPPAAGAPALQLQVAVKNSQGVFYFKDLVPLPAILVETPPIASSEYPARWQAMPAANQAVSPLSGFPLTLPHVESKVAIPPASRPLLARACRLGCKHAQH